MKSCSIKLTCGVGASEINISCVIEAYEANRAMNVLHTSLFTFLE